MRRLLALCLALSPAPLLAAGPHPAAVQVHQYGRGVIDSGSGTVVESSPDGWSLVLTNRHVTPHPGGRITVVHAGREYPAEWVRVDPVEDLALLAVAVELPAAELADELPPAGAVVEVWGFPFAVQNAVHKVGQVIGWHGWVKATRADVFATTVPTQSGDSGSAQLWGGRVVCVTWGGSPWTGCSCVGLPGIKRFLGRD